MSSVEGLIVQMAHSSPRQLACQVSLAGRYVDITDRVGILKVSSTMILKEMAVMGHGHENR